MKSVLVGRQEGELLKERNEFPGTKVPEDFRRRVLRRASRLKSYKYPHAAAAFGDMQQWRDNGEKELEVYGVWAHMCVAGAVSKALELGYKVRVPEKYVFNKPDESSLESVVYCHMDHSGLHYETWIEGGYRIFERI
jgi:nicotinamidase-related amidase